MYKDFSDTYWRMYTFVDDALSLEQPRMTKDFYEAGYAFGHFQRNLEDFPAETLYPVIPDFHNTPKRYEALCKAVKEDPLGRVPEVKEELAFLAARKDFYGVLNGAHIKGDLPLRVTHNDTKLNNVLLDESTGKALCVLDLDTIMPGFSVTDFGDAIRFGASTAAEDEEDLAKVSLDLDMYQAFSKGYLAGCDGRLTNAETELMPEGAKMMMLECGMRFLTDYILGDVYFKTDYPGHNLVRCRTQLKLAQDTEQKWDILKQMNQ